jgi:hypothetical protein
MTLQVRARIEYLIHNDTRIKEIFYSPCSLSNEKELKVINSSNQLEEYISYCDESDHMIQSLKSWISNKELEGFNVTMAAQSLKC